MTDPRTDPQAVRLPTLAEAQVLLKEAQVALDEAHRRMARANELVKHADANEAEGHDLAKLALTGNNRRARVRLEQQVRALHPAIVGYAPTPDANDGEWDFRGKMTHLSVLIDYPDGMDEEYLASLADALRTFVRVYQPKHNHPDAPRQGMAMAHARSGTLFYRLKVGPPGVFEHFDKYDNRNHPDETSDLVKLLANIPRWNVLAALADEIAPEFQ